MGWLEKIIGGSAAAPIQAIGNIVDDIHTSDLEEIEAKTKLQQVSNSLMVLQAEITKQEAAHRSVFTSGWRPAVGWLCVLILLQQYFIFPIFDKPVTVYPEHFENLLLGMMGIAGLRTIEKSRGLAR